MTTRMEIVEEARLWLDTPFQHQGRLLGVVVDCIGAVICPARARGIEIEDVVDYGRQPNPERTIALLEERMDRIPIEEATIADVLFLWFQGAEWPNHFVLVTPKGILHAYTTPGKCVETGMPDGWRKRVHSAWRFRGLE